MLQEATRNFFRSYDDLLTPLQNGINEYSKSGKMQGKSINEEEVVFSDYFDKCLVSKVRKRNFLVLRLLIEV